MLLVAVSALASCNSLEVTMPVGPRGEQGIQGESGKDGLSAYEVWAKAVQEKLIDYSGPVDISHFFLYLKGKDGVDGKDGKDGKDGVDGKDGANGKSAYELWLEYVASGVDDPHNPGSQWDKSKTSMADFYWFITGGKGDNGLIPYIKDGNWWIGDSDTGIKARGDKGDAGASGKDGSDGLSAYEIWKAYVRQVIEAGGSVTDMNGNVITLEDLSLQKFFQYLTGKAGDKGEKGDPGQDGKDGADGKDGENGKDGIDGTDGKDGVNGKDGVDGKDGADGKDGLNGKSAYELWVDDVKSASGLDDPRNPGTKWDPSKTTMADFYEYLKGASGTDGKNGSDGKSAYELWKELVLSDAGLANPGNGVYDPAKYPTWPKSAVSIEDFYLYLKGGDGNSSFRLAVTDTLYLEEADWSKYNVAPVRSLAKVRAKGAVRDTTYEYVNPYSGGCALIVSGPGPVALPNCTVEFKDQAGNLYSKTSDANGYIYLTRKELPEWMEGAPSMSDLSSRTRPIKFSYNGMTITDPSKIAATCAVPYLVEIEVRMTGSSWYRTLLTANYEIVRTVEGRKETAWGGVDFPLCNSSGLGYYMYRSLNDINRFMKTKLQSGGNAASYVVGDHFMRLTGTTVENSWQRPYGKEENTEFKRVVYGNGEEPAVVDVNYMPTYKNGSSVYYREPIPDYGLKRSSKTKTMLPEYCMVGDLDVKGLKGGENDEPYTSFNDKLVMSEDGTEKVPVNRTNYELILGQTSFSFLFDFSTFGHVYNKTAYYDSVDDIFRFKRYDTFLDYLSETKPTQKHFICGTFFNSGKLGGVSIDNKCFVYLTVQDGVIQGEDMSLIRNVYDKFAVKVDSFAFIDAYYEGQDGTFTYDESTPYEASCTFGDKRYGFQAIKDAKSAPMP